MKRSILLALTLAALTGCERTTRTEVVEIEKPETVEAPDEEVTTKFVVVDENGAPIEGADILGLREQVVTDHEGVAVINLPAGSYDTIVRADGFDVFEETFMVDPGNIERRIVLTNDDPVPLVCSDSSWLKRHNVLNTKFVADHTNGFEDTIRVLNVRPRCDFDGADCTDEDADLSCVVASGPDQGRVVSTAHVDTVYGYELPKEMEVCNVGISCEAIRAGSCQPLHPEPKQAKVCLDGKNGSIGPCPAPADEKKVKSEEEPKAGSGKQIEDERPPLEVKVDEYIIRQESLERSLDKRLDRIESALGIDEDPEAESPPEEPVEEVDLLEDEPQS